MSKYEYRAIKLRNGYEVWWGHFQRLDDAQRRVQSWRTFAEQHFVDGHCPFINADPDSYCPICNYDEKWDGRVERRSVGPWEAF